MTQSDEIEKKVMKKESTSQADAGKIIKRIMSFLQLFICETLVKRMISIVLIAVGVPNKRITELTGLCDKSVRTLKKAVESGDIDSLFIIRGGGRQRKLIDVEDAIIEDINNNNYHSRQQIADMIHERYDIKVSLPVVGRLLKKTVSSV